MASTYVVNYTDINNIPISVEEQTVDTSATDIALFGYIRLKYGELLNENLLHLLENFSCIEDPSNPHNPYLDATHDDILNTPSRGQFWFNTTRNNLYYWNGTEWNSIQSSDDIAANWGQVSSGSYLPLPVSSNSGYVFSYDECIWSVAPASTDSQFTSYRCSVDDHGKVTAEYSIDGYSGTITTLVNYLIIGIKDNRNNGYRLDPPPLVDVTPTPYSPWPTPTPSITPSIQLTVPVSPSVTPTPTSTPAITGYLPLPELAPNGKMLFAPSPADPGGPGTGGVATKLENTCGDTVTIDQLEQSYYITLQDLDGGVPPYTASFRWVRVGNPIGEMIFPGDVIYDLPQMNIERTYTGGVSIPGLEYERILLVPGNIPTMKITLKFDNPATFYNYRTYHINSWVEGTVTLVDSAGQRKTWWLPIETTGIQLTEEQESEIYHWFGWSHYADCSDCPDC